MVAQQSRAKKGKVGNGRKSMSQSIARNNNTATQDDENISINLILAILSTGIMAFIGILTETLTNVLFPGLMAEFHVDTSTVQWLTTGLSAYGSACHAALKLFQAQTEVAYHLPYRNRALHHRLPDGSLHVELSYADDRANTTGSGHGITLPLMFNIILEQSPKSKIGMLMGVGGMVVAVAPALGPTVGGLVGTFMPWRWIFVILLPFLFVSLVCGPKTIHQVTPTEEAHINPLHVLCLAVGFVCFVFALDRGGSAVTAVSNGDTSATTQCVIAVVLLLIAMAALLVFAWVSHRAFSPLVRLTVLRSVKFRWHLLAYVLLQFVTIGYGYMIPNASQLGFGASVLAAGVVLLPGALLGAASAPVSGSLLDKFGPVRPMFTAMLADLRAFASKRWLLCSRYVSSCPDPSTRWKNLDNSGVYVRADSSSEWENPDAGKHTNVPIPPVDGGFRTFKGRCAGVFLQWVEVFGL